MPPVRRLATVAAAALLLTGCFTGERPTLAPPEVGGVSGTPTGDPNVDAVLEPLEREGQVVFTANYTITRSVGPVVTEAIVTQDASRRAITVGRIRFLELGSQQTCNLDVRSCEDGWLDARISDTGVTHGFYRDTAARRLRIATTRKTGPTTAQTDTIAGYPATCVTVPVGAGAEQFCVNQLDVIARMVAADVTVELTAVTPSATEEQFAATS